MSTVGCVMRARWFVGGGACWLPVWARGGRLRALGGLGGYWRVVGEGVFLPPFFLLLPVFTCGLRGIERWRRGVSV